MRHRSLATAPMLLAALLGAACESSTEPSAVHLAMVAPDTVHGTLQLSNGITFLECIYPVRIQATGAAADSAVWLDGYWGYAPLDSNVVHASNTMSADELADWFGTGSIRTGQVQRWDMWFGYAPAGYWVEGYFTYASGRQHTRGMLNYRFVCVP